MSDIVQDIKVVELYDKKYIVDYKSKKVLLLSFEENESYDLKKYKNIEYFKKDDTMYKIDDTEILEMSEEELKKFKKLIILNPMDNSSRQIISRTVMALTVDQILNDQYDIKCSISKDCDVVRRLNLSSLGRHLSKSSINIMINLVKYIEEIGDTDQPLIDKKELKKYVWESSIKEVNEDSRAYKNLKNNIYLENKGLFDALADGFNYSSKNKTKVLMK